MPGFVKKLGARNQKVVDADEAGEVDAEDPQAEREIGFGFADANSDGEVEASELKKYLAGHLNDDKLPHKEIFSRMDADKSDSISRDEFEKRHDVIMHFMGGDYFGVLDADEPYDPGKGFVPFEGLSHEIDDRSIFGAIYHRYYETLEKDAEGWPQVDLNVVEDHVVDVKLAAGLMDEQQRDAETAGTEKLIKSTVIIAGGGREFFYCRCGVGQRHRNCSNELSCRRGNAGQQACRDDS